MKTGAKSLLLLLAALIVAALLPGVLIDLAEEPQHLTGVGPLVAGYVLTDASAEVVSQGDKCSGKNCKVLSLTATNGVTAGSAGFTTTAVTALNVGSSSRITWAGGNYIYNNGATGLMEATSGWAADVASGSNAFSVTQNGARIDFGAGANDYCNSDGTTITCAGPLRVNGGTSVQTVGNITSAWSSYCEKANCTKAETAADAFLMPLLSVGGTTSRLNCNWRTPGTNVGNTTGMTMAIFNATDSTELCNCSLGGTSCNTAAGVVTNCTCAGTLVGGKAYVVRIKSTTDCGTIPGLIGCTVTITQ